MAKKEQLSIDQRLLQVCKEHYKEHIKDAVKGLISIGYVEGGNDSGFFEWYWPEIKALDSGYGLHSFMADHTEQGSFAGNYCVHGEIFYNYEQHCIQFEVEEEHMHSEYKAVAPITQEQ